MLNDFDKRIVSLLIVECDHLIEVCDKNNDYEIRSSFILSDAIQYEFEKLFEDISRLSKEIQEDPTLHINELRGIRNRIAHNYETVKYSRSKIKKAGKIYVSQTTSQVEKKEALTIINN